MDCTISAVHAPAEGAVPPAWSYHFALPRHALYPKNPRTLPVQLRNPGLFHSVDLPEHFARHAVETASVIPPIPAYPGINA